MVMGLLKKVFGSQNDRELARMSKIVEKINALEADMQALDDAALGQISQNLRNRLEQESLDAILPEAFAAVREASVRTLGLRHFDVQLIGGISLHEGKIAEMRTGEGKTLVSTLASFLNAISGKGVHLVTVNDYLARRDAHWMGPIFAKLGMTVGVIQSSGAIGADNASFIFDIDYQGSIPNFRHLRACGRKEAYAADITYGTNNEFGFDYLRDNMVLQPDQRNQRDLNFAVVDEVDSILIDEARTPLVISGPAEDSSALYAAVDKLVPKLEKGTRSEESTIAAAVSSATGEIAEETGDFVIDEKMNSVELTEQGHSRVEEILIEQGLLSEDQSLYAVHNLNLLHHVHSALKAHHLNTRDVEYIVQNRQVVLIDQHTGRTMPGRRLGDGLHQAIEAKEGLDIQNESQTLASTTFQNFFRLYDKLSGMTGTADTEAEEFQEIYGLKVVVIPTNKPQARQDLNDLIYLTAEEKFEAVVADVRDCVAKGAPVLVGTISVESSELVSRILKKEKIAHQVLNAKYHEKEAHIVANAGRPGAVTIATNMAGRGTDIVLGGSFEAELASLDNPSEDTVAKLKGEWQERHQKVLDAGGLHIIGTERHESRRIDNQLRGRSGRQGDPGMSRFYISMEDSLMRLFASDRVRNIMQAIGMERGEAIEHRMVTSSIEKAQRKVEGRNFDIRKQLLEYDDVANDQRRVVYKQRNELLFSDDISDMIVTMRSRVVNQLVTMHMPPDSVEEMWSIDELEQTLARDFASKADVSDHLKQDKTADSKAVESYIDNSMSEAYKEKIGRFPEQVMRQLERELMLQVLDKLWKEHLATMDQLRTGIGLRGYGGRNPKQEYKRESFELFSDMLDRVRYDYIGYLSRVEIAAPEQVEALRQQREEQERQARERLSMQHAQASALNTDDHNGQPVGIEKEPAGPYVRDAPKLGRNDPCHCGSGKKYKQCHGKLG